MILIINYYRVIQFALNFLFADIYIIADEEEAQHALKLHRSVLPDLIFRIILISTKSSDIYFSNWHTKILIAYIKNALSKIHKFYLMFNFIRKFRVKPLHQNNHMQILCPAISQLTPKGRKITSSDEKM